MLNKIALLHRQKKYVLQFFIIQEFYKTVKIVLSNQYLNLRLLKPLWCLMSLIRFKKLSFVKIKDRCFITGRSQSLIRLTGLSRHFTYKYIRSGTISNFTNASW